jgi:hypothetical protein
MGRKGGGGHMKMEQTGCSEALAYKIQTPRNYPEESINKKKTLFSSKLGLNLRKKLAKCYIWSIALYGAEIGTFQRIGR